MDSFKHKETTNLLIKAFFKVYNTLGHGFIEKVYENAMVIEARSLGLQIKQQQPISVFYGDTVVGEYITDFIVNSAVIVELKAVSKLTELHEAQLMNYLKATPYEIGLLLNFGIKAEFQRRIMDNNRKKKPLTFYLGFDTHRLIVKSLNSNKRRRLLLFFLLLIVISIILGFLEHPLSDFIGLFGIVGTGIYVGILILLAIPNKWIDEFIMYRLLGISMILVGIIFIAIFVFDWTSQLIAVER